jgi:hypothetical protein
MKQDIDLIRRILKDIEALPPGKSIDSLNYPEYEKEIIHEHIKILEDEQFINVVTFRAGIPATVRKFKILGMKFKGTEFLKDIKDDSFFNKTKTEFIKTGAPLLISSFWEFLKLKAKEKIGLP